MSFLKLHTRLWLGQLAPRALNFEFNQTPRPIIAAVLTARLAETSFESCELFVKLSGNSVTYESVEFLDVCDIIKP